MTIFRHRRSALDPQVRDMLGRLRLSHMFTFRGNSKQYPNITGQRCRVTAYYFYSPHKALAGRLKLVESPEVLAYQYGFFWELDIVVGMDQEAVTQWMHSHGQVPSTDALALYEWKPPFGRFSNEGGGSVDGTNVHFCVGLDPAGPDVAASLADVEAGLSEFMAHLRPTEGSALMLSPGHRPLAVRFFPPTELPGCELDFWHQFKRQPTLRGEPRMWGIPRG